MSLTAAPGREPENLNKLQRMGRWMDQNPAKAGSLAILGTIAALVAIALVTYGASFVSAHSHAITHNQALGKLEHTWNNIKDYAGKHRVLSVAVGAVGGSVVILSLTALSTKVQKSRTRAAKRQMEERKSQKNFQHSQTLRVDDYDEFAYVQTTGGLYAGLTRFDNEELTRINAASPQTPGMQQQLQERAMHAANLSGLPDTVLFYDPNAPMDNLMEQVRTHFDHGHAVRFVPYMEGLVPRAEVHAREAYTHGGSFIMDDGTELALGPIYDSDNYDDDSSLLQGADYSRNDWFEFSDDDQQAPLDAPGTPSAINAGGDLSFAGYL